MEKNYAKRIRHPSLRLMILVLSLTISANFMAPFHYVSNTQGNNTLKTTSLSVDFLINSSSLIFLQMLKDISIYRRGQKMEAEIQYREAKWENGKKEEVTRWLGYGKKHFKKIVSGRERCWGPEWSQRGANTKEWQRDFYFVAEMFRIIDGENKRTVLIPLTTIKSLSLSSQDEYAHVGRRIKRLIPSTLHDLQQ